MKRLIFLLIIQLLFLGMYLEYSYSQYRLTASVQSGAGGPTQSNSHTLVATIGQLSPPESAINGKQILLSGFIYSIAYDALTIDFSQGTANTNEALQVIAKISPQQNVAQVQVYYRKGGEQSFLAQTMRQENENYVCSIPANEMTSRGIEFYIMATDFDGNTARLPAVDVTALSVTVAEPGAASANTQPNGNAQTAYRLISFPLDLDQKTPSAILTDDLGKYDNTEWRFYSLGADQKYHEFSEISQINPGEAFWLIVKKSGKVIDTGAGKTIVTNQKFAIGLHPGWNFIGNPFDFAIPLAKLSLKSAQALDIRAYQGSWQNASGAIQPFVGYAVANNAATTDTLYIDPYLYPVLARQSQLAAATEAELDWSIQIQARCQEALDVDNFAALSEQAAIGWDVMDRPEPPVIGDYVSVSFPHRDWDRPLKLYCTDVRPKPIDGETWEFEVRTNIRDQVTLSFEGLDRIPLNNEVWLTDEVAKISLSLRENNCYSLAASGEEQPRTLKLLVGNTDYLGEKMGDFQQVPISHELCQNYPNPFNPATTIRYGLPAAGKVTMKVYNLIGEEVITLVDHVVKPAGYHTAIWDGRNQNGQIVANGIYVYRLQIGKFTSTRKMVLVK